MVVDDASRVGGGAHKTLLAVVRVLCCECVRVRVCVRMRESTVINVCVCVVSADDASDSPISVCVRLCRYMWGRV